ncbi:hypothetical protein SLEP1_g53551 [Rubroshorea leprosula]|uniref:PGG domain-containing protein n=1 Tax=Rubroshorea leprosula TaxID=152421 RepID=A0AAV5MA92_9ROSI|nr:hypothetical protein SLEP1_g53551 [Rubroshorea leprosula]
MKRMRMEVRRKMDLAGADNKQQRRENEDDPNNLERKQFANAMLNAIYKGNSWKVGDLLQNKPDAISTTFEKGQTALQIAITAGQLMVATVLITIASEANIDHLRTPDENGNTALSFAARSGMMEIAKCLIEKKKDLLTIANGDKMLPVQLACRAGHEDMTRYLYRNTMQQECLDGDYGFYLLEECISTRVEVDKARVLSDGVGSVAAQRRALDEGEFVQSGAVEATFQAIKNGIPEIAIAIAKVNTNILWNRTDPEDSRNMFACAIANRQEKVAQFLYEFNARISTNIVFTDVRDGNNLLHLAAKLAPRSHLDYISGAALQLQSELRWFQAVKGIVPQFYNHQKNHGGETPSQKNGGEAPSQKRGGETPSEVFVKEHEPLLKEAEEWLKKTAESSTVVGALIITIMFAVAFTVPGGNDQNTGFPIFLNKTADSSTVSSPTVPFMIFIASDAISLFAASSSVLMFLGILTSRYAYKDFLKSLPVKLIVGISSLFISIAAMMVAFCVALFIMLQGRLWITIPVTLFAGVPVIIFVLLQFPFLIELYTSTFRRGIFDGKWTGLGKEEMESLQQ